MLENVGMQEITVTVNLVLSCPREINSWERDHLVKVTNVASLCWGYESRSYHINLGLSEIDIINELIFYF